MEGDLDVDEFGNTIYRKDFTGSYNNPNNLYVHAVYLIASLTSFGDQAFIFYS